MSAREVRCLGVRAPGEPYEWTYDEEDPGPGEVRLDTLYSGFSAGTELTFLKGTNPYLSACWDPDRQCFDHGRPGQDYPIPFLGYMEVGRVTESHAGGLAAGDLVAGTWGHKSGHTARPDRDLLVRLPAGLDPLLGVFVAQMGPIAANGVLHADAELAGLPVLRLGQALRDRRVLVVGGGTVGALAALFALSAGAEVLLAEPDAARRSRLAGLGVEVIDLAGAALQVKDRWHRGDAARGADVVLHTRAHAEALAESLRALRPQGCVIDLAFYTAGADAVPLGEEFHHNGLAIRCAQIGRTPRGTEAHWDRARLAAETLRLLEREQRRVRDTLVTHVVPAADAPAFLSGLTERRFEFGQMVFDYAGGAR